MKGRTSLTAFTCFKSVALTWADPESGHSEFQQHTETLEWPGWLQALGESFRQITKIKMGDIQDTF